MEKYYYTCEFCQREFEPKRRKVQRFCSNTCRSKNHYHIHNTKSSATTVATAVDEGNDRRGEQMSLAGIGNAAVGTALVDSVKHFFTSDAEKNATKKDIHELKELINNRYFLIHNHPDRFDGAKPYFDMATSRIVYFGKNEFYNIVP